MWQHVIDAVDCLSESDDGDKTGQDSFQGPEKSNAEALPPYESLIYIPPLHDTAGLAAERSQTRSQQALSETYSKYGSNPDWGSLSMVLVQRPSPQTNASVPWAAVFRVKCDDVARLMREGFYWSAENILPEEGYLSDKTDPQWSALGFRHARIWTLADKSRGDDPRWVAQIDVLVRDPRLLPKFEIQGLSRRNVWAARAWNPRDQRVYQYQYLVPSYNCNCICGDQPLHGWWPWPRSRGIRLWTSWVRPWDGAKRVTKGKPVAE